MLTDNTQHAKVISVTKTWRKFMKVSFLKLPKLIKYFIKSKPQNTVNKSLAQQGYKTKELPTDKLFISEVDKVLARVPHKTVSIPYNAAEQEELRKISEDARRRLGNSYQATKDIILD